MQVFFRIFAPMVRKVFMGMLLLLLFGAAGRAQSLRPMDFFLLTPRPDTVSLFIVGDIMSHRAVSRSAETYGYRSFFRHLEKDIAGADLAVGNLEFPMAGAPYTGYPAFSGPDAYADYLADVGFDVLLGANNHILDKGSAGLRRTLKVLDALNVHYAGIAMDPARDSVHYPLIVRARGLRIAFLNFTYGTNAGPTADWPKVHYMRKEEIAQALRRASEEADLVLVFPHWGTEYQLRHNAEQEEMARFLVEGGADAVIGTHPHVVQDVQYIDGVPVIYSLGNAISNQNDLPARLELAVTLRVAVPLSGEPRLLEPGFTWLWCTKPGMLEDSYATVRVDHPAGAWRDTLDYRKMIETYRMIYEENHSARSHRPD